MFKQKRDSRKWTWESPDGKTRNRIDFILINSKWKSSVQGARSFPSTDVASDHQLVICNFKLRFKTKPKKNSVKRYDVSKLKDGSISSKYQDIIGGKFRPLLDDPDTNLEINSTWDKIKAAFNSTAKEVDHKNCGSHKKCWNSAMKEAKSKKPNKMTLHLSQGTTF